MVHNLFKLASVRGLSKSLTFKISYDTYVDAVEDLFTTAYDATKSYGGV